MPPDFERAVRERALRPAAPEAARRLAQAVAEQGGGQVLAVLFFGSRKTGVRPDPWSAYDLFVVTREHEGFYRALRERGALRRGPRLMGRIDRLLPPTQVSFFAEGPAGARVRGKLAVLTLDAFRRETSERRSDHFCVARLFQPAELLFALDDAAREDALAGLVSAHRLTYRWVRPWLPATFDAAEYARRLLPVSLRAEIRPEPKGRADELWAAQRPYLESVYGILLEELCAQGELARVTEGAAVGAPRYRLARPVGCAERLRVRLYFRRSLARATARWAKHVLSFEGWLDYILHKAARHTGREIVLSERERRWPYVFLWPRLFQYLRDKRRLGG